MSGQDGRTHLFWEDVDFFMYIAYFVLSVLQCNILFHKKNLQMFGVVSNKTITVGFCFVFIILSRIAYNQIILLEHVEQIKDSCNGIPDLGVVSWTLGWVNRHQFKDPLKIRFRIILLIKTRHMVCLKNHLSTRVACNVFLTKSMSFTFHHWVKKKVISRSVNDNHDKHEFPVILTHTAGHQTNQVKQFLPTMNWI